MQVDTFLKIGKSHRVCEDYIISGTDPFPYIILADGCSSSKETEMGARLLCHMAKQYLTFRSKLSLENIPGSYGEMGYWVLRNSKVTAFNLGLDKTAIDTTLIISFEIDNTIHVYIYGDGCVLSLSNDGVLVLDTISFSNNAPFYLSYGSDFPRLTQYKDMNNIMKLKQTLFKDEDNPIIKEIEKDISSEIVFTYPLDLYRGVMVASDGLLSFFKNGIPGSIDPNEYIREFFAFKNTKGEFLTRRVSRILKDFENQQIYNTDDLSLGTFLKED